MITRKQFYAAYNKYPPKNPEKFFIKYFSISTTPRNNWLSIIIVGIFFILFIIGMIGTMANIWTNLVKICTLTFARLMTIFAISWIYAWVAHGLRIRKVRKELGVSREEYIKLVTVYWEDE